MPVASSCRSAFHQQMLISEFVARRNHECKTPTLDLNLHMSRIVASVCSPSISLFLLLLLSFSSSLFLLNIV